MADEFVEDVVAERIPANTSKDEFFIADVEHDGVAIAFRSRCVPFADDLTLVRLVHGV